MTISARIAGRSRARDPLSTTADCRKNCMYGEIVVPTSPTTVTRNAGSRSIVGTNVPRATAPQSGCAAIPDHTYAR